MKWLAKKNYFATADRKTVKNVLIASTEIESRGGGFVTVCDERDTVLRGTTFGRRRKVQSGQKWSNMVKNGQFVTKRDQT